MNLKFFSQLLVACLVVFTFGRVSFLGPNTFTAQNSVDTTCSTAQNSIHTAAQNSMNSTAQNSIHTAAQNSINSTAQNSIDTTAQNSINSTAQNSIHSINTTCFTPNSFEARDNWLTGSGYVMIHHVRRAGGTTLCGLLGSDNDLKRNCILGESNVTGRYLKPYSLAKLHSLMQLENEMKRQKKRVVAVEGYALPDWFLNDPNRSKKWTIVTSIRDPVDRSVSTCKLLYGNRTSTCWNKPLDRFTGFPVDNQMVRMFVGGSLADAITPVAEKDYLLAVKNLEEHYQLIFITEWIPEMTPLLKYWLGVEGSGNERRGLGGLHKKKASRLGLEKATLHYLPESSAKYYLRNEPEVYNRLVKRNYYDLKLFKHFQQREAIRATKCFLFRTANF